MSRLGQALSPPAALFAPLQSADAEDLRLLVLYSDALRFFACISLFVRPSNWRLGMWTAERHWPPYGRAMSVHQTRTFD